MNISKAYKILHLKPPISLSNLKQAYHKEALRHHPDRLPVEKKTEGKVRFQEVALAYETLTNHLGNKSSNAFTLDDTSYESILKSFIYGTFGNNSDIIEDIIKKVTDRCTTFSKKMLDKVDKKTLLKIYDYVEKYHEVLGIRREIKEFLDEYVKEKIKGDCVYNLNPSLSDIMRNDVYQLEVDDKDYYIPLWHEEVQFDEDGKCIIVRCVPDLPEHISIDHDNNVEVKLSVNLNNILEREFLSFTLADKEYNIPISSLFIKRHQTYKFENQGIPLIDTNDIYSCQVMGDVIVSIYIT